MMEFEFSLSLSLSFFSPNLVLRVLDLEPESEEDEDAIIERRRQLRKAIVSKYQSSAPATPQQEDVSPSSSPRSPASSEVIGERIEAELEEEEKRRKEIEEEGEGDKMDGITKRDPKEEVKAQEELKRKKTNLSALREAIRNGDMFSEDLFTEMQLVC